MVLVEVSHTMTSKVTYLRVEKAGDVYKKGKALNNPSVFPLGLITQVGDMPIKLMATYDVKD